METTMTDKPHPLLTLLESTGFRREWSHGPICHKGSIGASDFMSNVFNE
jgi:hypothetical protein